MKNIFFFFALVLSISAHAQSSVIVKDKYITSETEARQVINLIVGSVGLKPNFEIKAETILPYAAAITHQDKRYIIYNPDFIQKISRDLQSNWAGVSILAHEIGHHLNGHALIDSKSTPITELEADEFSGYVLRKMGATLIEAQAAVNLFSSERDSDTHPSKSKRLLSIEKGWRQANEQIVMLNKQVQELVQVN